MCVIGRGTPLRVLNGVFLMVGRLLEILCTYSLLLRNNKSGFGNMTVGRGWFVPQYLKEKLGNFLLKTFLFPVLFI